jgi:pentatricopeptide repeat protein
MNLIGFKNRAQVAVETTVPVTPEQEFAAMLGTITEFDEAWYVGMAAKRSQKFELAAMALERAAELGPAPYVLTALASTYRKLGDLEAAENLYKHVLENGCHIPAMVGLAAVYRSQKQPHQARELYDMVLEADRTNPYALRGLVGVYADINQPHAAEVYHAESETHRARLRMRDTSGQCLRQLSQLKMAYASRKDLTAVRRVSVLISWVSGEAA